MAIYIIDSDFFEFKNFVFVETKKLRFLSIGDRKNKKRNFLFKKQMAISEILFLF